jgi:hypothetical protein
MGASWLLSACMVARCYRVCFELVSSCELRAGVVVCFGLVSSCVLRAGVVVSFASALRLLILHSEESNEKKSCGDDPPHCNAHGV